METLRLEPPCRRLHPACRLRQTCIFARTVGKTDDSGLLAAQTACRRASWRPRRPPDGPPGAQDGLPTGLLAPKTASARASCRLHDNFLDEASVMTSVLIRRLCFPVDFGIRDNCLDDFLDETSVKRTVLQLHFTACQLTSVALCDGFTLVLIIS